MVLSGMLFLSFVSLTYLFYVFAITGNGLPAPLNTTTDNILFPLASFALLLSSVFLLKNTSKNK